MGDLVPVASLTLRTQRFRCDVLNAELSAGSCVARRVAVFDTGRNQHTGPGKVPKFPTCANCSVGALVETRVGGEQLPACGVCGVPVRGANGRRPLCKAHRGQKVVVAGG